MTNDGGNSWQTSDYLNSAGFRCVYFINGKIGWIAGDNVYKTNDGGKSWCLEYAPKAGIHGAKDMYFTDETCGWLINFAGQIYKYELKNPSNFKSNGSKIVPSASAM